MPFAKEDATMVSLVVLSCVGFVFLIVVIPVLNGLVLTKLWEWFVMPIFHIRQIYLAEAIGFSLIAKYLQHTPPDEDNSSFPYRLIASILNPLVALCFGWILHQFQ